MTSEELNEIYRRAHRTNVMSQLDEIELAIRAAKKIGQRYVVLNKVYDPDVISRLRDDGYEVECDGNMYPTILKVSWK